MNIKVRLNNEKRGKLKVGDQITFLEKSDDIESI